MIWIVQAGPEALERSRSPMKRFVAEARTARLVFYLHIALFRRRR
jgi:hypothetical protein